MSRLAFGLGVVALVGCQEVRTSPEVGPAPSELPLPAAPEPELGTELSPLDLSAVSQPVTGGHTVLLADGRIAIADPHHDRLLFVDWTDGGLDVEADLPVHSHPGRVAQGSDGTVWVALRRGHRVVGFTPDTATPIHEVGTCLEPRGLAADDDGSMWVACGSGRLVHFDGTGVLGQIAVGSDLRDVVIDAETGALWVSRFKAAEVVSVQRDGQKTRFPLPVFEESLGSFRDPLTFAPSVAWRMLAHPDGGVQVVHQRSRTSAIDVRENPNGVPGESPYSGSLRPPEPDPLGPSCSGILHGAFTHVTLDGVGATSAPVRSAVLPTDAAFGPSGDLYVAVAAATIGTDVEQSVIALDESAYAEAPCYEPAPVEDARGSMVSSIEVSAEGHVIAVGERPLTVSVDGELRFRYDDAAAAPEVVRFHQNVKFGVSCAGCHPEGLEDGQTWVFRTDRGEVARRTQAMGGQLIDTKPWHWDGEFQHFGDLMDEVWGRRMGGEPLSETELHDLELYIDAFARPHTGAHQPDLVARGSHLFKTSECASCHAGTTFTDNEAHDVGTGEPLQTPSLLGVSTRLPLMHAGCAETLYATFDGFCGGPVHGSVPWLAGQDVDALVAYLETL